MSYTYQVKNEIIKKGGYSKKEKIAELRGILDAKEAVFENHIELKLESIELANRVYRVLKEISGLNLNVKYSTSKNFGEHNIYIIGAVNQKGFKEFLKLLDDYRGEKIKDDEQKTAGFIRGLFCQQDILKLPKKNMLWIFSLTEKKLLMNFLIFYQILAKKYPRQKKEIKIWCI